jgi:hypothetical protein
VSKRKAPWKDYEGNDLYEGDFIAHPNIECGEVVFKPEFGGLRGWRVKYPDDEYTSWLALQIGKKGKAVKKVNRGIVEIPAENNKENRVKTEE